MSSRIKIDKDANYFATIDDKGYTRRMKFDASKPFQSPRYPEIEDVAINNVCKANCSYCYISAMSNGKNFENICEKAESYWGKLKVEERPLQIAIGS